MNKKIQQSCKLQSRFTSPLDTTKWPMKVIKLKSEIAVNWSVLRGSLKITYCAFQKRTETPGGVYTSPIPLANFSYATISSAISTNEFHKFHSSKIQSKSLSYKTSSNNYDDCDNYQKVNLFNKPYCAKEIKHHKLDMSNTWLNKWASRTTYRGSRHRSEKCLLNQRQ